MKAEFYPHVDEPADSRRVHRGEVRAQPRQHGRPDPAEALGRGRSTWGLAFDCFDPLSHTDDPRIRAPPRANRQLLKRTLSELGFVNLPEEWWHFTYKPEPFPDTYFDFPVAVAAVRP